MAERLSSHESHEPLQSPEQFIINKHGILIYGYSGTGKSSSIKLLSQRLQLPENKIYYTGKKFREHHKSSEGKDFIGPIQRDDPFDRKTDKEHQEYLLNAARNNDHIIIEGRLSPMHGLYAQKDASAHNSPLPQTYTILFSMRDQEKRFDGLYKREHVLNPSVTREQVKALTLQREAADLQRWNILYPDFMQGQNHFDPNFLYEGKTVYDTVVYFDEFNSAQEIADYLVEKLLQESIIEKKPRENNEIIIFP